MNNLVSEIDIRNQVIYINSYWVSTNKTEMKVFFCLSSNREKKSYECLRNILHRINITNENIYLSNIFIQK